MAASLKDPVVISKRDLLHIWREQTALEEKNSAVFEFVCSKTNITDPDDPLILEIRYKIKNFTSKLNLKWGKHNRSMDRFLEKESCWLDGNIEFQGSPSQSSKCGRPQKKIEDLSVWSKRRKVPPLVQNHSPEELTFAASCSLKISKRRDAASVVRDITESAITSKVKRALSSSVSQPIKYSPEQALALFIDGRFTKYSYCLMQSGAKAQNADIYPPYKAITKAKEACYPDHNTVTITETSAEVTLQGLVNHTATRLLSALDQSSCINPEQLSDGLTLTIKWGCDGSSGHSIYKQRFSSDDVCDSFIFIICVVPLELKINSNEEVIWLNPKPSSTRFCRPLKIMFEHETQELIKNEVQNIEGQISNLLPLCIEFCDIQISVSFSLKLTMIDGKTFSAITDTSSQTCAICGATPKTMNNLKSLENRPVDVQKYEYGILSLHAHIRFMECLLHISSRLDIKMWQIRDNILKANYQSRKKHVQDELKKHLGLLIDIPKPNYGTTNDGNAARRFFAHYETSSRITGIDVNLIKRFGAILCLISSGQHIDIPKFRIYTMDTAKLFVDLYPWYYMPSSVHRILIHGADIVQSAILPIGILSEEALEARNKDLRRYRENNTRKCSRVLETTDLFHSLLYSSDPLIALLSSRRQHNYKRRKTNFDEEVSQLLMSPQPTQPSFSPDNHESDEEMDM